MSHQSKVRRFLVLPGFLACFFLAAVARAQFSGDPAANLSVADRTNEQVQPKIVPTADGGCYLSWFDNGNGGYDVYLQRLDAGGVEQWAHNGVLVADRGFSSTQDYGLAVDTAGNALLAFRDDSGANVQIAAAKVDPSGTLLWGAGGILLTATADFVAAPKIAGTSDGNVVVAWTQDVDVVAVKLDPNGAPLWGAPATLAPASGSFVLADVQAAESGNAIVAFVRSAGGPAPRHLWAQKLASADGAALWTSSHVKVYDDASGSLQFGNFPSFLPDGSGGAVFGWYTSSPTLQCRAQRILANGTEAFAHNGVEVSTDATRLRVSPGFAWAPGTSQIFLFWTELNSLQSQFGLYGQKLDAAGNRQWGTTGKVLLPLGSTELTQVRALPVERRQRRRGRLGRNRRGLEPADKGLAPRRQRQCRVVARNRLAQDILDRHLRLAAASSSAGFGLFAWSDGDFGDANVLAQNLNSNGSLGSPAIFSDGFESGNSRPGARACRSPSQLARPPGWSLTSPGHPAWPFAGWAPKFWCHPMCARAISPRRRPSSSGNTKINQLGPTELRARLHTGRL